MVMLSLSVLAVLLPASLAAPVDFLAPQSLPAGCRLEVVTVQQEVEDTTVEKVVCETEFRPVCTIKVERDCRNVTKPACVEEEVMECSSSTASQCTMETRTGLEGEQEEVEVCRDIPIEDCQLVKEERCREGEEEEVEECEEREVEECEIVPHEECHQVVVESPRLEDRQLQQIVCDQDNEVEVEGEATTKVVEQATTTTTSTTTVPTTTTTVPSTTEFVVEDHPVEYDIYDTINSIFGGNAGKIDAEEDEEDEEDVDATTTEVEITTTEQAETTTEVFTTVAVEASTTTEAATTSTTEAASTTSTTVSTTTTPSTTSTTEFVSTDGAVLAFDNSRIHFRDTGVVRDFTKRIFVDDGLVDARRKAIEERRKALEDASRIFFPTEEESSGSPS